MAISDNHQVHDDSKRDLQSLKAAHTIHNSKEITVDGHSLDIATVVSVARAGVPVKVDTRTNQATEKGARLLQSEIDRGNVIYGVNTGFGGSADTRTKMIKELQATLIRELNSGILTNPSEVGFRAHSNGSHAAANAYLVNGNTHSNTCMPEEWVRASILIRINSLVTGHSGVRPVLIERMAELLRHNIVPRIPLRGSISASGDLIPLSYIGATLEGKQSAMVWAGEKPNRRLVSAREALSEMNMSSLQFGPKEGLAIINGTAVSTGVGVLAIHDASFLATLSQVLTAMSVEALRGTTESFDPCFDRLRPHPGQKKAATTIRRLLAGSRLTYNNDGSEEASLRQNRYAIRTASQWIGPVLEDLELASRQVTIECNSVTDNPLIDFGPEDMMANPRVVHGGNFQAKAVTSAVEKTRLGLQSIGQMLFAQCTEIINSHMNNGLPPNLAPDEPSQSFLCKPVDIMIAALQSELGFLSNPAGTAVQSAEMGNQSLNSLALISARYTHVALEVLSQLAACHLFVVCQALDLRAMHVRFLDIFRPKFVDIISDKLGSALSKGSAVENGGSHSQSSFRTLKRPSEAIESEGSILDEDFTLANGDLDSRSDTLDISTIGSNTHARKKPRQYSSQSNPPQSPKVEQNIGSFSNSLTTLKTLLWTAFIKQLDQTTSQDSSSRFHFIFKSLQPIILEFASQSLSSPSLLSAVMEWTQAASAAALETFQDNCDAYHADADATHLLGKGSRAIYSFVRKDLDVPFLRSDMLKEEGDLCEAESHRTESQGTEHGDGDKEGSGGRGRRFITSGEVVTRIYEAIRDGRLSRAVEECLEGNEEEGKGGEQTVRS